MSEFCDYCLMRRQTKGYETNEHLPGDGLLEDETCTSCEQRSRHYHPEDY